jgi:hypothetical protein
MQTCSKETHELAFAFHGGKRVHVGTSIQLYGCEYLSCIQEVDWANRKGVKNKRG